MASLKEQIQNLKYNCDILQNAQVSTIFTHRLGYTFPPQFTSYSKDEQDSNTLGLRKYAMT